MDRLFSPQGVASLSAADRRLLRECDRLLESVDVGRQELADAIERDDVDACKAGARRLLSVGLLLGELARYGSAPSHEEHGFSVKA